MRHIGATIQVHLAYWFLAPKSILLHYVQRVFARLTRIFFIHHVIDLKEVENFLGLWSNTTVLAKCASSKEMAFLFIDARHQKRDV